MPSFLWRTILRTVIEDYREASEYSKAQCRDSEIRGASLRFSCRLSCSFRAIRHDRHDCGECGTVKVMPGGVRLATSTLLLPSFTIPFSIGPCFSVAHNFTTALQPFLPRWRLHRLAWPPGTALAALASLSNQGRLCNDTYVRLGSDCSGGTR